MFRNKMTSDTTLPQKTKPSVDTLMELLMFCIKTTYFHLDHELYYFVMAMCLCWSPVLSKITYMPYLGNLNIFLNDINKI